MYTYQHIMKHYLAKRQTDLVVSTYDRLLEQGLSVNKHIMNFYFQAVTRNMDTDRIVPCLEKMNDLKMDPNSYCLKLLGETKDLPDSVWLALKLFPKTYGFATKKVRADTISPATHRDKSRKHLKIKMGKNKRIRLKKGAYK